MSTCCLHLRYNSSFSRSAPIFWLRIDYPGIGNRSEFKYDALWRLSAISELYTSLPTDFRQFVWTTDKLRSYQPSEERDGSSSLAKMFFGNGQVNGVSKYFYSEDHLNSVRQLTDASVNIQWDCLYQPFGRESSSINAVIPDFSFCDYFLHFRSNLNLTIFRQYDKALGRWHSRDFLELNENFYSYVRNQPVYFVDPFGLAAGPAKGGYEAPSFCNCYSDWCCFMNHEKCHSECWKLYMGRKISLGEYIDCRSCCDAALSSCWESYNQGGYAGINWQNCLSKYNGR